LRPSYRRLVAFLLAPAWVAINQPRLAYGKAVGLVFNNPSAAISSPPNAAETQNTPPPAGTITREHCDAVNPLDHPPLSWVVMIDGNRVNKPKKTPNIDPATIPTDPASMIKTLTLGLLAKQATINGINLDAPIPPELWAQAINPQKIADPKLSKDLSPYAITPQTSYLSDFRPEVFEIGQDGLPKSTPTYRQVITLIYHKSDNALAQVSLLLGLFSGKPMFYAEMTDSLNALAAELSPNSNQPFCLLSASGYPHIDHPLKKTADEALVPYPSRTTQITPERLAKIIDNLFKSGVFPEEWQKIFQNPNMVFHGHNFLGNNASFIEAVQPTYHKTGTSDIAEAAATVKTVNGIPNVVVTGGVGGRSQQLSLLEDAREQSIVIAKKRKFEAQRQAEELLSTICQGSMESLCLTHVTQKALSGFSLFSLQPLSTQTADDLLINGGFLAALKPGNFR
jgi:hypothetical protein